MKHTGLIFFAAVGFAALFTHPVQAQDVNEPNNDILSATPINCGTLTTGYIQIAGDVDWYEIQFPETGVLSAELITAATDLDLNLELYQLGSPVPELIAMDSDMNAYGGELVTIQGVISAGTYYLMIEDEGNHGADFSSDPYSFLITCNPSSLELNQTINEAIVIPADTCLEERIWGNNQLYYNSAEGADDQDWFTITLTESGYLTGELIVPASIDMNLELYRQDSPLPELLADDGQSVIQTTFGEDLFLSSYLEAGTYYFHLEDQQNNTTSDEYYQFCTSFEPSPFEINQTIDIATNIPKDTCFQERLYGENNDFYTSTDGSDDQDYYEFNVPDSCALLVQIDNVPINLDLNAEILRLNGFQEILLADDGFTNSNGGQALEIQTILPSGTFYLHIEDEGHNALSEELFNVCINCALLNTNSLEAIEQLVNLHPNPATDQIHINGIDHGQYAIIDQMGRVIQQGNIEEVLNVAHLSSGLYILQLELDEIIIRKSWMKQ